MITPSKDAPHPDLRIIPIDNIFPHEEHDEQRSHPLMERLKVAETFTNPPIVAPMGDDHYVVMDGANRTFSFKALGYKYLLVQVAPYDSGYVDLSVWQHIISDWSEDALYSEIEGLSDISMKVGWDHTGVAQVLFHDGRVISLHGTNDTIEQRNKILCQLVARYRQNATLNRTAIQDPNIIWRLYPDAVGIVLFPHYDAEDIINAARHQAFLPPGVSRHIIQGRALKLNYPMALLRDAGASLEERNEHLQAWIREKLANRAVRYYAESTYQFDE